MIDLPGKVVMSPPKLGLVAARREVFYGLMRNSYFPQGIRSILRTASYRTAMALLQLALGPTAAMAVEDPLNSVNWSDMRAQFLGQDAYVFDDRVKVSVPNVVENQAQVPVTADASALADVQELVVFADLNPIQHVLTLMPINAKAVISFRMKVERGTPIRAAALTADGVWHVGGTYLDASGGGCSAPALARQKEDWSLTVGNSRGRLWQQIDGTTRVRLRVRHPMDTGLTLDNVPAFYIERLQLRSTTGALLATVNIREPVSEDPTFTLQVRLPLADDALLVVGRDIGGNVYTSKIPARSKQSRSVVSVPR